MENSVGLVNQWCQKTNKVLPYYTFVGNQHNGWSATATADWLLVPVQTERCNNKKEAKQLCASLLYEICTAQDRVHISPQQSTLLIIDGDQRADCWKWLANDQVTWSKNITVKVYTGPTTPIIQCNSIEHIPTTSPGRDSADALMLMDLGAMLALKVADRYILVSSDHILVQTAASTENVLSAANLTQLKAVLKVN